MCVGVWCGCGCGCGCVGVCAGVWCVGVGIVIKIIFLNIIIINKKFFIIIIRFIIRFLGFLSF